MGQEVRPGLLEDETPRQRAARVRAAEAEQLKFRQELSRGRFADMTMDELVRERERRQRFLLLPAQNRDLLLMDAILRERGAELTRDAERDLRLEKAELATLDERLLFGFAGGPLREQARR